MWVSAFCQAVDCMALTCACASHVFLCGCIFVGIDVYIACIKNCSMCGEIDSHGLSVCLTEASVTKTYSSHCFEWLNREGAFRVTHVSIRVEWVENETWYILRCLLWTWQTRSSGLNHDSHLLLPLPPPKLSVASVNTWIIFPVNEGCQPLMSQPECLHTWKGLSLAGGWSSEIMLPWGIAPGTWPGNLCVDQPCFHRHHSLVLGS